MKEYTLFVDLDGVLVDFDSGVTELFGRSPDEIDAKILWPRLAKKPGFYEHLPWMSDGKQLWLALVPFSPFILTGLPRGTWAEPQKRAWCGRELGGSVPVITCWSKEKAQKAREHTPAGSVPVLLDDRLSLREAWEAEGGIFVHHRSAESSLRELREKGILP